VNPRVRCPNPSARFSVALVLAALTLPGCGWPGITAKRPDIILVVVDSLRADYLGCYGFQGDVSPALDRLASESILYDNAVAPSPWTKPSVASLFTSLDPLTHRVLDQDQQFGKELPATEKTDVLAAEARTLAEALGDLGYETAAWVANPWIEQAELGFRQGFAQFRTLAPPEGERMILEVQEWVRNRAADPKNRKPIFLYMHFMDVHGPYQSTPELLAKLSSSPSLGDDRLLNAEERWDLGYLDDYTPWRDLEAGLHLRNWRASYASSVRLFDDRFGRFLAWLRSTEQLQRPILVFTSDHGEDLLEHGRWSHGFAPTLFQHSIRIPLLIRLSGGTGGGRRDDRMTGLFDVMPTLLRLAGDHREFTGLEGAALLDSKGRATADTAAWSFSGAVADNPQMVSVQDRAYKLIWEFPEDAMAFYNVREDPDERVNLALNRAGPDAPTAAVEAARRRMAEGLATRIQRLRAAPGLLATHAGLDSESVARLKALGYLQ